MDADDDRAVGHWRLAIGNWQFRIVVFIVAHEKDDAGSFGCLERTFYAEILYCVVSMANAGSIDKAKQRPSMVMVSSMMSRVVP